MKLKIEYLNKEQLKSYANNAKLHPPEQVEQIKKSIQEFGFNDPIAVWHDNEVIEGHGRLLAVMEMPEIEKVPVIRLDDLTDEQRRAYMLVHNKLTMNTGFDFDLLQDALDKIISYNMSGYGCPVVDVEDVESLIESFGSMDAPKSDNKSNLDDKKAVLVWTCPCCGEQNEVVL